MKPLWSKRLKNTAVFLAGIFSILLGFAIYLLDDMPDQSSAGMTAFGNVLYYTPNVVKIALIGILFGLGFAILSKLGSATLNTQNNS